MITTGTEYVRRTQQQSKLIRRRVAVIVHIDFNVISILININIKGAILSGESFLWPYSQTVHIRIFCDKVTGFKHVFTSSRIRFHETSPVIGNPLSTISSCAFYCAYAVLIVGEIVGTTHQFYIRRVRIQVYHMGRVFASIDVFVRYIVQITINQYCGSIANSVYYTVSIDPVWIW